MSAQAELVVIFIRREVDVPSVVPHMATASVVEDCAAMYCEMRFDPFEAKPAGSVPLWLVQTPTPFALEALKPVHEGLSPPLEPANQKAPLKYASTPRFAL